MSIQIETLVFCDGCGANCNGDDRTNSAKRIRATRSLSGWIQRGSKDYCPKCSPQHQAHKRPKPNP